MRTATIDGATNVNELENNVATTNSSIFDQDQDAGRPQELGTIASDEDESALVTSRGKIETHVEPQLDQDGNKVDLSSEGDDANLTKREVDQTIASELRQQEDSYKEQITSLDIKNVSLTADAETQEEQQQAIEAAIDTTNDSDDEFRRMDERIQEQVIFDKKK